MILYNRLVFGLFFCLIFSSNLFSQATDSIYIWQGFEHNWTYNHRINRIGNFIDDKTKEVVYTSASGLGADSTYFTSRYTLVTNSQLYSSKGKTNFQIQGKEKDSIHLEKIIHVAVPEDYQGKNYDVLLDGFDLLSNKKADKLIHFDMKVSKKEQAIVTDFINIKIEVTLQAACSTLECSCFKHEVDYSLDIYYQVLFEGKEDFQTTVYNIESSYYWNKKITTRQSLEPKKIVIGKESFKNGVVGFQEISISMDDEHWFMQWHNILETDNQPQNYNGYFVFCNSFFREWKEGMKKNSAYPKHSRFSKRNKGSAELKMGLLLLQFKQGDTQQLDINGKMFWRGKNKSAASEAAVWRGKIN